MRSSALTAALPALLLSAFTSAQTSGTGGYTVVASVIFARTGERTTVLGGDDIRLTPYGAQQMFSLVRRFISSSVKFKVTYCDLTGFILPRSIHRDRSCG